MEIDWYRFFGTALVVSVIGPLFWLLVGVIENRLRRGWFLLRERWNRQQAKTANRLLK